MKEKNRSLSLGCESCTGSSLIETGLPWRKVGWRSWFPCTLISENEDGPRQQPPLTRSQGPTWSNTFSTFLHGIRNFLSTSSTKTLDIAWEKTFEFPRLIWWIDDLSSDTFGPRAKDNRLSSEMRRKISYQSSVENETNLQFASKACRRSLRWMDFDSSSSVFIVLEKDTARRNGHILRDNIR